MPRSSYVLAFFMLLSLVVFAGHEPGDLDDMITTPGNGYEIYYTNDPNNTVDVMADAEANDVADTMDPFVTRITGLGFGTPHFSYSPGEVHMYDSQNIGAAPEGSITLDSPSLRGRNEPSLRAVTDHEHFHHTQYHYINFNDWPSWGRWTVEGTARLMQDKLWNDLDADGGMLTFWGEISNYMAQTDVRLVDQSYSACLFWQYLCEQLGTVHTEPEYGVDVIRRFWEETDGESPDSLGAIKRMISHFTSSRSLDDLFRDFAVASYTKDLDLSSIANAVRYRYIDDDAAAYPDVQTHLRKAFPPTIGPTAAHVNDYAAKYYIGEPAANTAGQVVGFKSTGNRAAYSVMAIRSGKVISLHRGVGTEYARSFFNSRKTPLTEIAAVVAGLDSGADYSYTFAAGEVTMSIVEPTFTRLAYVGEPDNPDKFIARMQVTGPADLGGGTVWGLQADDFTAKVGVQDATVVSGSYVQGEFWLLVQAPKQTSGGPFYNLQVKLGDLSATQESAVIYAKIQRDEVIVVDGSGSMLDPEDYPKIDAAKAAALMYADSAPDNDQMAVVSFGGDNTEPNEDATTRLTLREVGPNRNAIRTAVSSISIAGPSVLTSIGDGLNNAQNELDASPIPDAIPFIVLLSDGMENEARYWESSPSVKSRIKNAGTHVISIALGPTSDQALMQDIALETDGFYYYVDLNLGASAKRRAPGGPTLAAQAVDYTNLDYPVRLADVYKLSHEFVNGQSRIWENAGVLPAGVTQNIPFTVDEEGITQAALAVFWSNAKADVKAELRRPDGSTVNDGQPGVRIFTSGNHIVFHMDKLDPGPWSLRLTAQEETDFIAMLSGQAGNGLRIRLRFPAHQEIPKLEDKQRIINALFLRGLPMPIEVTLADIGGPIVRAEVLAHVYSPDGRVEQVPLFDDGLNGDSRAGDGIFYGVFRRTTMASQYGVADNLTADGQNGSYLVLVNATGEDSKGKRFIRLTKGGFQVYEFFDFFDRKDLDPDPDKDGMPSRWENLYGLNPLVDDAKGDLDQDQLPNLDEYVNGTIPNDPDSDHGGENDRSELGNNRNNYDPRDDQLPRPIDCGVVDVVIDIPSQIPQPKTNLVYFPLSKAYRRIHIFRGDSPNNLVEFKVLDVGDVKNGVWPDEGLTNGKTYYYQIVAEGESGALSAPSRVFAGTAKDDPVPPKGWIKINNGAGLADSLQVKLDLDTSDDAKEMRISNDAPQSGAAWKAIAPVVQNWVIQPNSKGNFAYVYAKFRDAAGNESVLYNDSVRLVPDEDPDGDGLKNSADPDNDGDGLTDLFELYKSNTNPYEKDSDRNGISDDKEDPDGDTLTNLQEQTAGTDPWKKDTDGDGFDDNVELTQHTNPNDPGNYPGGPAATATPTIGITRPTPTPTATRKPFIRFFDKLILAQGWGGRTIINIKNFDPDAGPLTSVLRSFSGAAGSFLEKIGGGDGRPTFLSSGDLDNDGSPEVVITLGPILGDALFPNILVARNAETREVLGHSFVAFPSGSDTPVQYNGGDVRTAVGNFTGSGLPQIAAAQGRGGNGIIRLYQYTGQPAPNAWSVVGQFNGLPDNLIHQTVSGVTLTVNIGMTLAAGDLDNDGRDELLVGQMNGPTSKTIFHALDINEKGGIAKRTPFTGFPAKFQGHGGVSLAVADLNGDGWNEIIAASMGNLKNFGDDRDTVPLNLVSVIIPVVENGQVIGFRRATGRAVFNVFRDAVNPSGMVSVAAGEFDGNPETGQELVFGTGAYIEMQGRQFIAQKSAPESRYRIVKVTFDGAAVLDVATAVGPNDGFPAFIGDANPPTGSVFLGVIRQTYGPFLPTPTPTGKPTVRPTPTVTPTATLPPAAEGCVEPSAYFTGESETQTAAMGLVRVQAPVDVTGKPIPIQIRDCADTGRLGIFLPLSDESMAQKAQILFAENLCEGKGPVEVRIDLVCFASATFLAYDNSNALVDSAVTAPGPAQQTLILTSASGIKRITITGAEICILRICWNCSPTQPVAPPTWVPFDPKLEPGSPIHVSVLETNEDRTILRLQIPGYWVSKVNYAGREFSRIDFPDIGELDGQGFEPGAEWYEFPKESSHPPLSKEKYRRALSVRAFQPVFPEELAKQTSFPRTGEEMLRLGIDPSGARPRIPVLAGILAVNSKTNRDSIVFTAQTAGVNAVNLPFPLVPAGFEGLDQTQEESRYGYTPPELVDETFYSDFKGEYTGPERNLSDITHAGAFSGLELRTPLVKAVSPKVVQIASTIDIEVLHPGGVLGDLILDFPCPIAWDSWIFKLPFINGEALRESLTAKGIRIEASRSAHYLILTPSKYESQLTDLINFKRSKGLFVDVVTVGAGADVAADRNAIDAYIEDYFKEHYCKGVYVLIIGDVDEVPAGRTSRIDASPDFSDADSDHVYEVIGSDRFPSLYVGRLSCNSADELQFQLNKILSYEQGFAFGTWPSTATLCANSQNDDGCLGVCSSHPSKYAAAVNEIASYGAYTNPPTFEVFHAGAKTSATPRAINQDVIDAINEGRGQVLYRGHGDTSSWVAGWDGSSSYGNDFDMTNELPLLDNSVYPIIYSIACQNGRIKTSDCIGEAWMNRAAGAVAHWGASVNSYTTENHNRAKGVFRAIYDSNFTRLSPALAEAEQISWNLTGDSGSWDNNTFCYILLGDPELTIRRYGIVFTGPIKVILEAYELGTLLRLVGENGQPVAGALLNLALSDDSSVNGITSEDGVLILPDVPSGKVLKVDIHAERYRWQEFIPSFLPTPSPTPRITPTPTTGLGEKQCVEAGDVYTTPAANLSSVNLGWVEFFAAVQPDGTQALLSVEECSRDSALDVFIPGPDAGALRKARMVFSANVCQGQAPQTVEVTLMTLSPGTLYARDDGGAIVDTAAVVLPVGAAPGVQTLTLESPTGIRWIEIEGGDICVLRVCWTCGPVTRPTPTLPPGKECVEAGDVYTAPQLDVPMINLGAVAITQAYTAAGGPVPISVTDCSGDGRLDVSVPWSEATAVQKARIRLSPNLCGGLAPQQVEVVLMHGNYCILTAFDEGGAIVDSAAAAAGPAVQTLTLTSPSGIREIEIDGSEICILRVCWVCRIIGIPTPTSTKVERPTPTPTNTLVQRPTPTPTRGLGEKECVEASDVYTTPAVDIPRVNLGWVEITQALLATGAPVPLSVIDCSGDHQLDISIPWSEATAAQKARITFSGNVCRGKAPQFVEVVLLHAASCTLYAYDDANNLVDTATASPDPVVQTLTLGSSSGIRTIEVEGAEICILKICWICEFIEVLPTATFTPQTPPTATFTPQLPPTPTKTPTPQEPAWYNIIEISCREAQQHGGAFIFSLIPRTGTSCDPFQCDALASVRVEISCEQCVSQSCEAAVQCLVDQLVSGINQFGNGAWTAIQVGPGLVRIEGPEAFDKCVSGGETGLATGLGWPLTLTCDVNNVCNGITGDERSPYLSGYRFRVIEDPTVALADPLWVDDDNQSGFENGSEAYPFNTIAEAMDAAVNHTIRVRAGTYPESVTLKPGVKLIGAGADSTLIKGSGAGDGISCSGAGADTEVSGFTINGFAAGIHCLNASPKIRENVITNIDLGSTSGDGIRLQNSSPEIRNNVIARVGGMGIRGEGGSAPSIINNTIYDYRYYAGISFASLDIGAVSPVIKNNIIQRGNTLPVGGVLWKTPATPVISYNDVFDPANVTGDTSAYARSDGATWTEMSGGAGALAVDPRFVDALNGYFYLLPISPCIDAGDPDPSYNDNDGSRNDMGAYGGLRIDLGGIAHTGTGFLFTSVGRIPITEIVQDSGNPSFGLADVSAAAASDFSIPQYQDSPFGGYLWLRGLFGAADDVDYYQIIATSEDGSEVFALSDPLVKTLTVIHPDGSTTSTSIQLGPQTLGGVQNLYQLNKTGYWSQQDLRMIWNTGGRNGRYRLDYKAYKQTGPDAVALVNLLPNTYDHVTLWLDNSPLEVAINQVLYANNDPIVECEDITFPHAGSSQLQFDITANHANGFLRYYVLDSYWGHSRFGGRFVYDQYVGSHDAAPPLWPGVNDQLLPPLSPTDLSGNPMAWEDCAYRFYLEAGTRTTDGFVYLQYGTYSVYHSVTSGAVTLVKTGGADGTTRASSTAAAALPEPIDSPRVQTASARPAQLETAALPIIPILPSIRITPVIIPTFSIPPVIKPTPIISGPIIDVTFIPLITAGSFVDEWVNADPDTGGMTKILITRDGNQMTLHAYGNCVPTDCDWGEITVPYTGNPFTAVYDFGFQTRTLTLQMSSAAILEIHDSVVFSGGGGYETDYLLVRRTLWVDDDNNSGVEDGTQTHPYNTIAEGVNAGIRRQIVRVMPGQYQEAVVMKNGLSVLGSGADTTFIDAGGATRAVDCIGIGSDTIFSGFTVRNADLGIYCHTASLTIRENLITEMDLASLAADGIRMDDSSPTIQNNVIFHVGGMGIRAQGNCQPTIVNNTICDYGYYAGISFAALNIGAVAPVIMNNIIVRGNTSPVGGILWRIPAAPVISYNDVYDPANVTGGGSYYAVSDGTTWTEVSGGAGALSADPVFVDAANGYFFLASTSPCIDAGNPAPQYNDNDGTRNDMGAFGGIRYNLGGALGPASGFVFTSIGKIPITEIVKDKAHPAHGLLRVSDSVVSSLHVPKYWDTAFGGALELRGLFGPSDPVDYYQIVAAPYGTSATAALSDPLSKIQFTINPDNTVTTTTVKMGPHTIGGVPNLYLLNKAGYWTFTDLRMIWNTAGLNGKYSVSFKAYRQTGPDSVEEVALPRNTSDRFTIEINNHPVQARIDEITYADGTEIMECEKVTFPHNGNSSLIFTITAWHPDGFLMNYRLNCYWGNNRYGGQFTYDQYTGSHDAAPPVWNGVSGYTLSPLLPLDGNGDIMPWQTCPYNFYLEVWARITDGVQYLVWGTDSIYQSIIAP
ncbi:MAG: C25 family cysteine peptidase [bacterium]